MYYLATNCGKFEFIIPNWSLWAHLSARPRKQSSELIQTIKLLTVGGTASRSWSLREQGPEVADSNGGNFTHLAATQDLVS